MRNVDKNEVIKARRTHADKVRMEVRQMRAKGIRQDYWAYCKNKKKRTTIKSTDFNKFTDFFRNLNNDNLFCENNNHHNATNNINEPRPYHELDREIEENEILEAIDKLKNAKACGLDSIANEYIKVTKNLLLSLYVKIFNIVYSHGVIPESWTSGVIKPIYKNKGPTNDPDNYRPITILSCLGKLFTSVLNSRITKYLNAYKLLGEEQLGFRASYSTIDGIFVLHSLRELLRTRNKKLFCAFIDLKKCFGSIWRDGLWLKLYNMNLGNKMMNVMMSIYNNVKSCISMYTHTPNGKTVCNMSEMFNCENGLREGENLSPLLFSIYVNDLHQYLNAKQCKGTQIVYHDANDIMYYMKMLLLMYADDTVLFATTKTDLQTSLNAYTEYCTQWKLKVNVVKTKIVCFGTNKRPIFTLNREQVEVLDDFKYLGVVFNRNGRFFNAMRENINKARLAMFTLRKAFYDKHIPIDCQLDLIEKTIEPILLYGCEVWGFENTTIVEKYRLKIIKQILGLRQSTPSYMVYGESGTLPLLHTIHKRMISFWHRMITNNPDKLTHQLYKIMLSDSRTETTSYKWIKQIERILNDTGFTYMWLRQTPEPTIIGHIKNTIHLQGIQNIYESCNNSDKGKRYAYIKPTHETAHYNIR